MTPDQIQTKPTTRRGESNRGRVHTDEEIRKMRMSHLGVPLSVSHKLNISKANTGKKHTAETKLKISKSHKGKIFSEEHRRKLSISHKGQKAWNKGIKTGPQSELCRKRHSLAMIGKNTWSRGCKMSKDSIQKRSLAQSGSKNGSWIDGRSKNKEYTTWLKQKNGRLKRALIKNGDYHTYGEWETLKVQHNLTCPCCHKSEPTIKLTIDHVIPLSRGGSNKIENIQPLCKSCNCRKHTKTTDYRKLL